MLQLYKLQYFIDNSNVEVGDPWLKVHPPGFMCLKYKGLIHKLIISTRTILKKKKKKNLTNITTTMPH